MKFCHEIPCAAGWRFLKDSFESMFFGVYSGGKVVERDNNVLTGNIWKC